MLKKHNEFFKSLMRLNDLLFISLAWWLAYALRFYTNLFGKPESYVFRHYVIAWLLVLPVWATVFELLEYYRPRRLSTYRREIVDLMKCSLLALLIFLAMLFLIREIVLSRVVVVLFWFCTLIFLNFSHIALREGLRFLRYRGFNLRHSVVVGTGAQARQLLQKLKAYRHLGYNIVGVFLVDETKREPGENDFNAIHELDALLMLVRSGKVDGIFITLPLDQSSYLHEIQQWFGDEPIDLHFVPDLGNLATLRGNVEAFSRYGIVPRMLVGATERDLPVSLFGMDLPTPLFMCPIGVIGLCSQDFHGDIAVAKASAQSAVPMVASTLTQDRMEDVTPHAGDTPGLFQLYTPTDKELTASFLRRAEQAGYKGVVVTLDTWILGWRPRDLNTGNFPQLRAYCLENYFTDEVSCSG